MFSLLKKEINTFFSSITGYLVIIVFLLLNSAFMWVFKGGNNVLESGYASLDSLFTMAPWIFLFLVPAITMRMFAEEKRSGTLELLFTRPVSAWKIVISKFLAAWILVLISIIPTLAYFVSVYLLGAPQGNIDTGGTWGSYIGLLFLGGIYAALGVYSSSLTDNQIVAFILAVMLSFLFYLGFDLLSTVFAQGEFVHLVEKLGIQFHYLSISRGVLDSRDLIYFAAVIFIFLYATRYVLLSRKW
mgnify:FL=1